MKIDFQLHHVGVDTDGAWIVQAGPCPQCNRLTLLLGGWANTPDGPETREDRMVYPTGVIRPVPAEVPDPFATDFRQANAVLPASPKASAALSRRILQSILREHAGVKPGTLDSEIQQVLDTKALPSWLADDVDAVRNIGNFGAHPIKSTNTGEVVEVESGEAEWLINVLEGLLDFYFVEPAKARKRRESLNAKLEDAGKPALKTG